MTTIWTRTSVKACRACLRTTKRYLSTASTDGESQSGNSTARAARLAQSPRSVIFTLPLYSPQDAAGPSRPIRHARRVRASKEEVSPSHFDHIPGRHQAGASPAVACDGPDWIKQRMDRTPERACIVTREKLPSDYLINLRPTLLPPTAERTASLLLLPDRLSTPSRQKLGKGFWVKCDRSIVSRMISGKGPHMGILRQVSSLQLPSNLSTIIQAQLVSRVLYEVDHLARRIAASPTARDFSTHPLPGLPCLLPIGGDGATLAGPQDVPEHTVALLDLTPSGTITASPTASPALHIPLYKIDSLMPLEQREQFVHYLASIHSRQNPSASSQLSDPASTNTSNPASSSSSTVSSLVALVCSSSSTQPRVDVPSIAPYSRSRARTPTTLGERLAVALRRLNAFLHTSEGARPAR